MTYAWTLDVLDPSTSQIAAAAALIECIAVVAALLYAKGQLVEARAARESMERPFVVIEIDFSRVPPVLHLVITNYGRSMARNIRFDISPELKSSWNDRLPLVLTEGMPSLAPGREIAFSFDVANERTEATPTRADLADRYDVRVTYEGEPDHRGKPRSYVDDLVLDFGQFEGLTYIDRKTVHDLHGELQKLRTGIELLRPTSHGRGILTWTAESHAASEAAWRERQETVIGAARKREQERQARLEAPDGEPPDGDAGDGA